MNFTFSLYYITVSTASINDWPPFGTKPFVEAMAIGVIFKCLKVKICYAL